MLKDQSDNKIRTLVINSTTKDVRHINSSFPELLLIVI